LTNLSNNKINELLFKISGIDPTCGTGEFLVNLFDLKYNIAYFSVQRTQYNSNNSDNQKETRSFCITYTPDNIGHHNNP
jgi:type II restriction/modification system DNA methylase subunit YeeA